jgi:UDP-glucose 4-epimerase
MVLFEASYLLQAIPYEIAPRRKGDVDSLYASCTRAEEVNHGEINYIDAKAFVCFS